MFAENGLGKEYSFNFLITIARRNGIAGFIPKVLRDNRWMRNIFNQAGYKVMSVMGEGVYSFEIDF